MPSLKLFNRSPDRPTLRQRAADLRDGLARAIKRPPAGEAADQNRRTVIAGTLAMSVPLPAAAGGLSKGPHPDAALLAAEERVERARAAEKEADRLVTAAGKAVRSVKITCPDILMVSESEARAVYGMFNQLGRSRLGPGTHLRMIQDGPDTWACSRNAWTGDALRAAIRLAVPLLGQGGQTPHRIKHWRELLPIADAFDHEVERVEAATAFRALRAAHITAQNERIEAERAICDFVATTPEGLAVLTKHVGRYAWQEIGGAWPNLLRSAAAVSGVDLASVHAPWNLEA